MHEPMTFLDFFSGVGGFRKGKMFRYPEHLARVNGTLFGIPYRPQPEQER